MTDESKVAELNELEAAAVDRTAVHLQSARKAKVFQKAMNANDVDELYEMILGDDEDRVIDLLNDDQSKLEAFLQRVIKSAKVKKVSR